MGRVAHYDEWSSPANFMFRCDPEFDFVVHATKLITDIPGQNDIFRSGILPGGSKASNRPPNEQSMLWLRWDRTTSQLSGSLLPHIANAEEGVVTEAETRLNWTPTEYKLRTASQRPADRVPDIHIARGDVAPGALVRRNCSWYREKVEPSQFRSGGHLIGFHFVFGKVEARRMTDLAARDEAVICISVVRSTGQVKLWPGSSGFCGPHPSETVLAQAASSEAAPTIRSSVPSAGRNAVRGLLAPRSPRAMKETTADEPAFASVYRTLFSHGTQRTVNTLTLLGMTSQPWLRRFFDRAAITGDGAGLPADVIVDARTEASLGSREEELTLRFGSVVEGGYYILQGLRDDGLTFETNPGALSRATWSILSSSDTFFVNYGVQDAYRLVLDPSYAGYARCASSPAALTTPPSRAHGCFMLVIRKRTAQPPLRAKSTYFGWTWSFASIPPYDASRANDTVGILASYFGTDKSKDDHKYSDFYGALLDPIRQRVRNVSEFGVAGGQSLLLWRSYFPQAEVHGFDLPPDDSNSLFHIAKAQQEMPSLHALVAETNQRAKAAGVGGMVRLHLLDATRPGADAEFARRGLALGSFDLLVEDAGRHDRPLQESLLRAVRKYVRPGGFYVIEDVSYDRVLDGTVFEEHPARLQRETLEALAAPGGSLFLVNTAVGHRLAKGAARRCPIGTDWRMHNSHLLVLRLPGAGGRSHEAVRDA